MVENQKYNIEQFSKVYFSNPSRKNVAQSLDQSEGRMEILAAIQYTVGGKPENLQLEVSSFQS